MKNTPVSPTPQVKWGWSIFMFLIIFSLAIIILFNSETNLFNVASEHLLTFQPNYYISKIRNPNLIVFSGFAAYMLELPWENYAESYRSKNTTEIFTFYEIVFRHLLPYLVKPPETPINSSCSPPPAFSAITYNCTPVTKVPKIGILLQFGFDSDILEIYFREMCDIVENFFIIESTKSYFRGLSKPLLWPLLREQERFKFCKNKVVHFIIDDSDVAEEIKKFQDGSNLTNYDLYTLEALQERKRWEKFLIWNNSTKVFKNGDLLGFGDSDEIPSRRNVEFLKTCKIAVNILDVGTWFPFGRINQAFKTDFPVRGHPFTYGDPTFWKFDAAMTFNKFKNGSFPSRRRGFSGPFLLGGVHFSFYGYLPFVIAKMLSTIEQNSNTSDQISNLSKRLKEESIRDLEESLSKTPEIYMNRIKTLEQWKNESEAEYQKIVVFPWFYNCNRQRYPAWEGKHDTRLD